MVTNVRKHEQLKTIRDEVWNLTQSSLYEYRKKNRYYPVLGEGSHDAAIMFIGEAPGQKEAETGRPFCGHAGRLLDEMLASIDMKREAVYITNIVKDRPPGNRDPMPEEIELYAPFLLRQIEIIQPKVIVTLGRFSMKFILEKFDIPEQHLSISLLHGRTFPAKTSYGTITILPLYHPAVALYKASAKETLFADFKNVKQLLPAS